MQIVDLSDVAAAMSMSDREHVALIGGGGKTTALFALGDQLAGSVVLTTTTKMGSDRNGGRHVLWAPTDAELRAAIHDHRVVVAWREDGGHKAIGVGPDQCDRWFELVDHVVVEADGSRRKPFKAPRDYEPVVPDSTTQLVACVGSAALGGVIDDVCHRPDRVAEVVGCAATDVLTPVRLAAALLSDDGSRKGLPEGAAYTVLVNKVGSAHEGFVSELDELLGEVPVIAVRDFGC